MAIGYVSSASANGGASSVASVSTTMPTASVGDLALLVAGAERNATTTAGPAISGGAGSWTVLSTSTDANNVSATFAWRRLQAGDLGATITATNSAGNRRCAIGIIVLSGAEDPEADDWSVGAWSNTGGSSAIGTAPNLTPDVADALHVTMVAARGTVSPFTRTMTPGSGFTERVDDCSSNAAQNGHVYISTKALTGQSGVSQTGESFTSSGVNMHYQAMTFAVSPVTSTPATVTATTVGRTATVNTPTVSVATNATVTPATVARAATVNAPTVVASKSIQVAPPTVAASVTLPVFDASIGARADVATVARTATVGTPAVVAGGTLAGAANIAAFAALWDDVPLGNPGWVGGDGCWSVMHPSGEGGLFSFGDTPVIWDEGTITLTGDQSVNQGVPVGAYFIVVAAEAAKYSVGSKVQVFQSDGTTPRTSQVYRVTSIGAPAFGYVNVMLDEAVAGLATNDVVKEVTGGESRYFPNSSAVLWTNGGLELTSGTGNFVPNDGNGTWHWSGPMVVDNDGQLYVFASKQGPGTPWTDEGHSLHRYSWTSGLAAPVWQGKVADLDPAIGWGAAVVRQGSYIYIYGSYHEEGWFGNRLYLARCPLGDLDQDPATAWEFWGSASGGSWISGSGNLTDISSLQTVLGENPGVENSLSVAYDNGRYHLCSKAGGVFGSDVTIWSSTAPQGPFDDPRVVASAPYGQPDPEDQTYITLAHYGLPRLANGQVMVSVSRNRSDATLDDFFTGSFYRPAWFAVDANQATVEPATIDVDAVVGAATARASATHQAATVARTSAVNAPTLATGTAVAPPTTTRPAVVNAASLSTGSRTAPATIGAAAAVGTPSTGGGTAVNAATIASSAAVGAPTVTAGARSSPATAAASAVVGTPALAAGASTVPATVARPAVVNAPTVSATTNRTLTPATIASNAAVGTATVAASSNVTVQPATTTMTSTVNTASVSAGSSASPAPATIMAAAAVGSPGLSATSSTTAQPATVGRSATVGAVTITAGTGATVSAVTAAATAAMSSPAVSGTSNATSTPATVAASTAVYAPQVQGGANAAPAPATLAAAAAVSSPSVMAATNSTTTPATIARTSAVNAPTTGAGTSVQPGTVARTASVYPPTIGSSSSGTVTPPTIGAVAVVQVVTVSTVTEVGVQPATVARWTTVGTPVLTTSSKATPATVMALATVLDPVRIGTPRRRGYLIGSTSTRSTIGG